MTPQEAIELLEEFKIEIREIDKEIYKDDYEKICNLYEKMKQARQLAINALEKQIQKKPIKITAEKDIYFGMAKWKKGNSVYKCPNCESFVNRSSKYCSKCGQALDWSNGNE